MILKVTDHIHDMEMLLKKIPLFTAETASQPLEKMMGHVSAC